LEQLVAGEDLQTSGETVGVVSDARAVDDTAGDMTVEAIVAGMDITFRQGVGGVTDEDMVVGVTEVLIRLDGGVPPDVGGVVTFDLSCSNLCSKGSKKRFQSIGPSIDP
jgi:hypothetical protein